MLIVALVLAVIGLAALVTAVVTSNELIAWICIGASVLGVLLLIVDAVRERTGDTADADGDDAAETSVLEPAEDYPEDEDADIAEAIDAADTDDTADTADVADTEVTTTAEPGEHTEVIETTRTEAAGATDILEPTESPEVDSAKKD